MEKKQDFHLGGQEHIALLPNITQNASRGAAISFFVNKGCGTKGGWTLRSIQSSFTGYLKVILERRNFFMTTYS